MSRKPTDEAHAEFMRQMGMDPDGNPLEVKKAVEGLPVGDVDYHGVIIPSHPVMPPGKPIKITEDEGFREHPEDDRLYFLDQQGHPLLFITRNLKRANTVEFLTAGVECSVIPKAGMRCAMILLHQAVKTSGPYYLWWYPPRLPMALRKLTGGTRPVWSMKTNGWTTTQVCEWPDGLHTPVLQ